MSIHWFPARHKVPTLLITMCRCSIAKNAAALSIGATFTPTCTTAYAFLRLCVACNAAGANGSLNVSVGTAQSGTSLAALESGVLNGNGQVLFSAVELDGPPGTYTEDAGWTQVGSPNPGTNAFDFCYKLVSATTTVPYAPSWATSHFVTAIIASFNTSPLAMSGTVSSVSRRRAR